jgi:hypothetical protein
MACKKGYSDKTREKNIESFIGAGENPKAAVGKAYGMQRTAAEKAKHRAPRLPKK